MGDSDDEPPVRPPIARPDPTKYQLSFEQLTHMLKVGVGVVESEEVGEAGGPEAPRWFFGDLEHVRCPEGFTCSLGFTRGSTEDMVFSFELLDYTDGLHLQ